VSEILVGIRGWGDYDAPYNWKGRYGTKLQVFTDEFERLEVRKTFHDLPRIKTGRSWRDNAREDFTVTVKARQAPIHTGQSDRERERRYAVGRTP